MDDIPLGFLFAFLVLLILLSALFSSSETALMSLNRYRLRHQVKSGHPAAIKVARLLEQPDRLLGLILLGNNFVNILASAITTVIALQLIGEIGIPIATLLLTLVILIFAEVAPKTLAAQHPERIAFPAGRIYTPLLRLFYPLVWAINGIANNFLRLFGFPPGQKNQELTHEELRTILVEAGRLMPAKHSDILLSVLDLGKVTVEDIMIPRSEVVGININDPPTTLCTQITESPYTRIPVYRDTLDNIQGFLHVRRAMPFLFHEGNDLSLLEQVIEKAYFVPESTPLNTQLLNFQKVHLRVGLVVDEYGELMGLVTLEDILEEIIGKFTTDPATCVHEIHPQDDGSYLVDASVNIRELNREMKWLFPTDGPKTLNGLILEYLETIPNSATSLILAGYPMDIVKVWNNTVKTVRLYPQLYRGQEQGPEKNQLH